MKILFTISCVLTTACCMAQAPNTLSAAEKKAGWKLLFDGKSTAGWHTYNKSTAEAGWKVADGALYVDTTTKTGRGDLTTNKEYD
ncbi:MAG TPA: family 16 glycoside hydrolase, partial [Chitinophagaceae bacterium]|nr:family 16 glycoside hydrolase [Chitinophagaceae bacterium]